MSSSTVFECPLTKYKIEYVINEQIALLNTIVCDYKNFKAFIALLRMSVDKLIKRDIKFMQQTVAFEEWDLYLEDKTTWQIKQTDEQNEIYLIECDMDMFLTNYGIGIGVPEFV
jgi:hypothetical protein